MKLFYKKRYNRLRIDYNITYGISRGNAYACIKAEKERDNLREYIDIELGKVLLHAIRCRDLPAFSYWMGMSTGLAGTFLPAKDYAIFQEAWAKEVRFKYKRKQ
jgi:hypothetical protein